MLFLFSFGQFHLQIALLLDNLQSTENMLERTHYCRKKPIKFIIFNHDQRLIKSSMEDYSNSKQYSHIAEFDALFKHGSCRIKVVEDRQYLDTFK